MVEAIQAGGGVIKFNALISSIALTNPDLENSTMTVTAAGQKHIYPHVISTLPMPNLRIIDLTGSKLDVVQANALRGSDYGASPLQSKLAFDSVRHGGRLGRIEMATTSTSLVASRSLIYPFARLFIHHTVFTLKHPRQLLLLVIAGHMMLNDLGP
jgi:hypothetical protein